MKIRIGLLSVVAFIFLILTLLFGYYGIPKDLQNDIRFINLQNVLIIFNFGLLLLLLIIEIISKFFDKTANKLTAFLTLCILLLFVTTYDILTVLLSIVGLDISNNIILKRILVNINFTLFLVAIYIVVLFIKESFGVVIMKNESIILLFSFIPFLLFHIILSFYNLQIIAICLATAVVFIIIITSIIYLYQRKKYINSIFFTHLILVFMSYYMILDGLDFALKDRNTDIYKIIFSLLIFFFYVSIYLDFIIRTTKESYKKEELEIEINNLQSHILTNQINPHYIFNTLNLIKSLYSYDKDKGNKAIDLFSYQMRAIVESKDTYLVELNKELEVLMSYIELVELRKGKHLNIFFDIDNDEFLIPYFSLEPLLENAIKYSKALDKEDGYIKISSTEEDDYYILSIEDNGVGFDVSSTKDTSTGLKNIKSRYKLLLNSDMIIESEINKGTKITFKIKKVRE